VRLAAALAALTLIRLIVAAITPLAPDEAYYWTWSHALAAGYADHPPMVALWIKAGTLIAGERALGVRLLGPLSAALGSWLLADAADRLFPARRAGIVAALLLNATLFLGVGSVIMTPDTPLLFFWCATIWALSRIAAGAPAGWWLLAGAFAGWWLLAGAFAGLALDSKYTAVMLFAGVGVWLVWVPSLRRWLIRPAPWLGGLLGLALFLPNLAWNQQHGWVSMVKQGGRVADWRPERAAGFLAELLGSQLGLATPGVWLLCVAGLVAAGRIAWRSRDPAWSLLAALSLPPVAVFVQHALGDRVQGNWPAIIYPAAAIAAAGLTEPVWLRLRRPAIGLGFGITALAYLQAAFGLFPLPPRLDPIALRLGGWEGLATQVETARQAAGAGYVAADDYALAAELAWELPAGVPVVGSDARWAYTALPEAAEAGATGLLVRSGRRADGPDPAVWHDARLVGEAVRSTSGAVVEIYRLFKVGASPRPARAVRLPSR
jgi:4-amino-4-deoxy-L-arabinose transferase-like glycosyltransferase